MIDAAPMEMLFASPLIIGTCGIATFGIVTASLSSRSGCGDNCAIACRIASYVACRILISSILSGPIVPSPVATACSMMISYSSSLFAAESFLESLIYNISQSFGRITAPATTGPASGPRPTSSIPQIYVYVSYSFHISLNFPCGSFPSVAYPCVFLRYPPVSAHRCGNPTHIFHKRLQGFRRCCCQFLFNRINFSAIFLLLWPLQRNFSEFSAPEFINQKCCRFAVIEFPAFRDTFPVFCNPA